jgi:SPP1 family predicted phage head-tail adaptor
MGIASMIRRANHRASLQRAEKVATETGSFKRTWSDVATAFSCWVQDASSALEERYAQRQLVCTKTLYVDHDLEIKEGDRVVFRDQTYSVIGVRNAAGLDRLWAIDLSGTTEGV